MYLMHTLVNKLGRMALPMAMCNTMCFVAKLGSTANVGVHKFVLVTSMKLKYLVVNNILYPKHEY